MTRAPRMRSVHGLIGGCLLLASCKDPPPVETTTGNPNEAPTPGDVATPPELPPDEPLPTLRTGTKEPDPLPAIEGRIVAAHRDDREGAVYLELELPPPSGGFDTSVRAVIEGSDPHIIVPRFAGTGNVSVLMRSKAAAPAETVSGTLYLWDSSLRGRIVAAPFVAKGPASNTEAALATRFYDAWSTEMFERGGAWWVERGRHPWHAFASARVHPSVRGGSVGPVAERPVRPSTELASLMYTTTAATSIQEALQYDRGMGTGTGTGPRIHPLAELAPPALVDHPFDTMLAALPNPDPKVAESEPLTAATPADFWYVRFDDIRMLLRVLDEADAWLTPVAHVLESRAEVHDLAARYQRQLGLRRSGLAKTLGHTVVDRLAIVGSDPYLREGSDVTFVFDIAAQPVFDNELRNHLEAYRGEIPGIATTTVTHGAHTITVDRDPEGLVRRHRAQVGELAIVSNSLGACKAVLDAIDGKRPRLSEQKDLAYMLARDPGEHDAFAFLGDRFIAAVVGPAQKVQESRRQRALAELLTPGYAALLYGWLEGKPPSDTATLAASKLLRASELRHADGSPIEFTPGKAPRSSWGSPAALTPLIDLPAVDRATAEEKAAYATFVEGYQNYWRNFIDPIAVRLDVVEDGGVERAVVDVRVLPLISGTDYAEIEAVVGQERVEVPAIDDGAHLVWAVGADSDLRREIDRSASSLSGKSEIGIGWLGDWVMVGAIDRAALAEMLAFVDDRVQLPRPRAEVRADDDLEIARRVGKLPVFAAAHVRNPTALVAALTAIRGMLNEVAPGAVSWGEHAKFQDVPIVRVGITSSAPEDFRGFAEAIALYYAQVGGAIVFALDPKVLEVLIARFAAGTLPKRGPADGAQFVVEGVLRPGKAASTALLWALQGEANRSQPNARASAEILLRGDPSLAGDPARLRELGLAYFGNYPVSASGKSQWSLTPAGPADPDHGTEITPVYPALPIAGSPIAALIERVQGLRATVAFDREPAKMDPPARSLHTHFELRLGPSSASD